MASSAGTDEVEGWTETRFRALTEHSADIISLLDGQGRLLFNSAAAERISGFTREELADADTFAFMYPDDVAPMRRAFEHVCSTPDAVITVEYRYRHKSGAWTWMEATATNRLRDPEIRGIVTVSRDISERKRAEEALSRMAAVNETLIAELREAEAHRIRFLAMLSHELRNPVAAIRGSVGLLEHLRSFDDPGLRALAIIDRQSRHLGRLMDDLLDVSRIAHGRLHLERATVDLTEIVGQTMSDLQVVLRARHVKLALPATPLLVEGDRVRIAQAISNLIDNAAKFTSPDGTISVTLERAGSEATLEVADDGVGIDADSLARLFEPFVQSDLTLERSKKGLGLGLAIVKSIVELHGGEVRVDSDGTGAGSRFLVRLPLVA